MATNKEATTEHRPGVGFEGEDDYEQGDWQDADDFLGAAVPSVAWPQIGATVTGKVLSVAMTDQTDPDGKVRTFADGSPRKQAIITLQTDEHEDDDDDGRRRLFVKGFMVRTFREEMRRNKVKGVRAGGQLTVAYEADGEASGKGMSAPKLFSVSYTPPAAA